MPETERQQVRPLARGTLKLQSDERLLKLFRRDVEPAFDELVNRYRAALVGYAGSIAGPDRAEDVVQESLVKAHRSLKPERDIEPRPWLYSVVRNTALNDVRDNRKHRHADLGDSTGGGTSPDELVEQRERFAAVLAAVADLPPAQRRALVDHEVSGFSHEEIAAELELSTGATKQLIYRARLSLRNAFGAMIPIPLITWLAAEGGGLVAAGGAAGTGGAAGVISTIGGGTAAKLAVVAVVAGGSLAGGIAVEKNHSGKTRDQSRTARTTVAPEAAAAAASTPAVASGGSAPGSASGSGPFLNKRKGNLRGTGESMGRKDDAKVSQDSSGPAVGSGAAAGRHDGHGFPGEGTRPAPRPTHDDPVRPAGSSGAHRPGGNATGGSGHPGGGSGGGPFGSGPSAGPGADSGSGGPGSPGGHQPSGGSDSGGPGSVAPPTGSPGTGSPGSGGGSHGSAGPGSGAGSAAPTPPGSGKGNGADPAD
ncbi:MAG: RNA polymerase sigma factor [Solirubrobacterales bacterium]|nr:RNA polymerase sigma factor [Solirubrobacterales bacterium]HMT05607.1 RNA polymerase sigma factor [Solirubrobacterales bacterium]